MITTYVGNWFEWTGNTSSMKKYYYAGGQRVARRTGMGGVLVRRFSLWQGSWQGSLNDQGFIRK